MTADPAASAALAAWVAAVVTLGVGFLTVFVTWLTTRRQLQHAQKVREGDQKRAAYEEYQRYLSRVMTRMPSSEGLREVLDQGLLVEARLNLIRTSADVRRVVTVLSSACAAVERLRIEAAGGTMLEEYRQLRNLLIRGSLWFVMVARDDLEVVSEFSRHRFEDWAARIEPIVALVMEGTALGHEDSASPSSLDED